MIMLKLRANYDIRLRPEQNDFCSTTGYLVALRDVIRCRPGACIFAGLPCSSWVWINRGTSKRGDEGVEGNLENAKVVTANTLVARFAILAVMAMTLGIHWIESRLHL